MKAPKTIRRMGMKTLRAMLFMALVSGLASITAAQEKAKTSGAIATAKSQTTSKPTGGPQEGVKVHGHWVIEVRNSDGTLVTRREFENALDGQGKINLAALLARAASGGHWVIALDGASGPCPDGKAVGGKTCFIAESGSSFPLDSPGPGFSTNLSVTLAGAQQNQVVLSGSVSALAAGDVYVVSTQQGVCAANVAPQSCANATSPGRFSGTFLNAPIPIQQGQIVQVTVTFSFS